MQHCVTVLIPELSSSDRCRAWATTAGGHPRLSAAPEVETVAIMIAEKSFRHLEGMETVSMAAKFNIASQAMCFWCTN